jgi:hypothetical protein
MVPDRVILRVHGFWFHAHPGGSMPCPDEPESGCQRHDEMLSIGPAGKADAVKVADSLGFRALGTAESESRDCGISIVAKPDFG